ncbi:hypothetical protein [Persephonella sp.]
MFKAVEVVEADNSTNAYDYLQKVFEKELNDLSEYDDGSTAMGADMKLEIGKIKL